MRGVLAAVAPLRHARPPEQRPRMSVPSDMEPDRATGQQGICDLAREPAIWDANSFGRGSQIYSPNERINVSVLRPYWGSLRPELS